MCISKDKFSLRPSEPSDALEPSDACCCPDCFPRRDEEQTGIRKKREEEEEKEQARGGTFKMQNKKTLR